MKVIISDYLFRSNRRISYGSFIIILALILFLIDSSYAQYTNVMISNQYLPNEVSIMINPKNPLQIVAGSNIYTSNSFSGYYYSTNGGLNWSGGILNSSLSMPSGDPVIIVDTLGNFYYIQNSNASAFDRHLVMKSTDGGMTWPTGSTYGKNGNRVQDKPWGCVDLSHGPYGNYIYSTWTEFSEYFNPGPLDSSIILFTRSTDGGNNWAQPLRISKRKGNAYDSSNTMEGAVPCTGPNSEIFVSWAGPLVMYSQFAIFFNRSTDGGLTWLDSERVAAMQPGGWEFNIPGLIRCNGMPVTCCDLSNGPFRGNIYINFSDKRNGPGDIDVWLIKSTNGGMNWSSVKRVNDDPPGNQQFFNWMTVDQVTGYIYFIFYDQRFAGQNYADVFVARSTDGGETFQNVKISSSYFFLSMMYFLGDYTNISAYNGHVRPIWTRIGPGTTTSIYTAIMDTFLIGIKPISENVPAEFSLSQNYPNPFNPSTKIKFAIPPAPAPTYSGKGARGMTPLLRGVDAEGGRGVLTRLIVYDLLGREAATLVNEQLQPGTYEVEFDGTNYPSGVYFYRLQTEDFNFSKRMVLIK